MPETGGRPPVNVARIAAVLMERFPGSLVWYGQFTGHWWALVCSMGYYRLLEAPTSEDLAHALTTSYRRPVT